jgi:hypothetical protein
VTRDSPRGSEGEGCAVFRNASNNATTQRHIMDLVDLIAQGFGIALIIVTIHTIITSRK